MVPSFAVILTTYRRPDLAERAIESVRAQTNDNWQLIVVVDDTGSDYSLVEAMVQNDHKTTLLKNQANIGKNASVNRALEHLKTRGFFGYIVFLDDDDWLADDCLATFASKIAEHDNPAWLVSQRAHCITGESFAHNDTGRERINYPSDMLLFRHFRGETTHCVDFSRTTECRFPTRIKNAEEWLYFASVAKAVGPFIYIEKPGTYSAGYPEDGLTRGTQKRGERFARSRTVLREVIARRLFSPFVLAYMAGRFVKSVLRLVSLRR